MAVKSADRKPEKYIGSDGKPRIRMVPVDTEVVKSEAKDGDGVNIVKDRPFKGKPMDRKPGKVGIKFSDMRKSKWAKDADANPKRAKAMGEGYSPDLDPDVQKNKRITKSDKDKLAKLSDLMKKANEAAPKIDDKKYADHMARNKKPKTMTSTQKSLSDISKRANEAKEVDEISLKDLSTTIAKSTGNKNLKKALKIDKLKADLAKMKMATEAKDPEEYDKEGDMAKTQLKTMIDAAQELHDQLSDDENMPEWVQNKITKATDYIDSVRDYMKNNDDVNEAIDMSKVGTKATIMHPITRVSKKVDKKELTKYIDKGWKHMGPKKQRVTWGTKKEETQLDEYGGPPISRAKYLKQKPMKERELTPGEMKKREKYAQDLPDAEFKKRYGDRWKSVKIATATKMAKGEK